MKIKIFIIFIVLLIFSNAVCAIDFNDSKEIISEADNQIPLEKENVNMTLNENEEPSEEFNQNITVNSFTDLSNLIDSSDDSSIYLNESYMYNSSLDSSLVNGVIISKNLTLIGQNGCFIDGNDLARCLFIDSNCHITLKNITFKNGFSKTSGAGVYLKTESNLTVYDCKFYNNYVFNSDGGAINGEMRTNVECYNCEFYNNSAARATNMSWEDFKAGMGCAICMDIGSNLTLFNSLFRNNTASLTVILLISFHDAERHETSRLHIKNCTFENNTSKVNGVLYLDELGVGNIEDSIFRDNINTESGGTISLDSSLSATVKNCLFEGNSATKGGAIYMPSYEGNQSNVTILNCSFSKNSAEYGGAIFAKNALLNIINTSFNQNHASLNGGSLYSNMGTLNIDNSSFNGNTAVYGGACLLKDNTKLVVSNSSFTKNVASLNGGAIYFPIGYIKIFGCAFEGNSAENGGALFSKDMTAITDSSFTRNKASKYGGAIYSGDKYFKVTGCDFERNSAQYGGAIYSKSKTTIIKSSFMLNKASKYGGAIYSGDVYLKVSDSDFEKNSAQYGGAIYSKSKDTVTGSSFTSNSASKSGGAIYSKLKQVSTSKCTYKKNSASSAPNVYGAFKVNVIQYTTSSGDTKLAIKLYSLWKMPLSQKIKFSLKGYSTGWLKTNSKGKVIVTIPKKIKVGKKYLTITLESGVCYFNTWIKKDPGRITVAKTVKKSSKLKVTVKSKATGKAIKKTKFLVKVYTKNHYKTYKLKTNSKGAFKISMKIFSKGKHKVTIFFSDKEYYISKKFNIQIK